MIRYLFCCYCCRPSRRTPRPRASTRTTRGQRGPRAGRSAGDVPLYIMPGSSTEKDRDDGNDDDPNGNTKPALKSGIEEKTGDKETAESPLLSKDVSRQSTVGKTPVVEHAEEAKETPPESFLDRWIRGKADYMSMSSNLDCVSSYRI